MGEFCLADFINGDVGENGNEEAKVTVFAANGFVDLVCINGSVGFDVGISMVEAGGFGED